MATWPTENGLAWERYYGYGAHDSVDYAGAPDVAYDTEPPAWVLAQERNAIVAQRFQRNAEGDLVGVLMPKTTRRNLFSAAAAKRLVAEMEAFGATVALRRSAPVIF